MGQAKLRGTYDQRKALAEAERIAHEQKRLEELAQIEASLTLQQRQARAKLRTILVAGVGWTYK